ncbi:MAG TPA: cytochrome c1 [Wenzhouxiangellaceae bacterium]|nr:cytochrome c1 [Wenzhouxiangellaceae bacterium]
MIRIAFSIAFLAASSLAWPAGGGEDLEQAGSNVHNLASVQRGAAMFMNYCHSCHSAQYMRYQRLARDLELTDEQVSENLVFGNREMTDYMLAAMPDDSERWFGKKPPDLTLTSRSRGEDWIYSFLKGFYLTEEGWNNTVLANASMPNVLWELQGIQRPVMETWTDESGEEHTRIAELEIDQPGLLTPAEYDQSLRDLVAFMTYLGEPAVLKRESMGVWVLLFLVVFTFLAWLLYKEYWRDIKK